MRRKHLLFLGLSVLWLTWTGAVLAQEKSVSMRTFYPEPIAAFDRIRLVPQDAVPSLPCNIGEVVLVDEYNSTKDVLFVCHDNGSGAGEWAALSGPWTSSTTATEYKVFPTDSSNGNIKVGIGTGTPAFALTLDEGGSIIAIGSSSDGEDPLTSSSSSVDSIFNPRLLWMPKTASFAEGRQTIQSSGTYSGQYTALLASTFYPNASSKASLLLNTGGSSQARADYSVCAGSANVTYACPHAVIGGGAGNYTMSGNYHFIGNGRSVKIGHYSLPYTHEGDANVALGGGDYADAVGRSVAITASTSVLGVCEAGCGLNGQSSVLLAGGPYNYIRNASYSVIGGGTVQYINDSSNALDHSVIIGGYSHANNRTFSTITGGDNNETGNNYITIGGGKDNTASALFSTILGGQDNTISAPSGSSDPNLLYYSVIGGGQDNLVGTGTSFIGGGDQNTLQANGFIGSGDQNTCSATCLIGGGKGNTVSSAESMILGGESNTAAGAGSWVGGHNMTLTANSSFLWGHSDTELSSTGSDFSFIIRTGKVGVQILEPEYTLDIAGGMRVTGKMYLSSLPAGAAGSTPVVSNSSKNVGYDLAEVFPLTDTPQPGDVMVIDENNAPAITRSTIAYDSKVVGIVSRSPAITLEGQRVIMGQYPVEDDPEGQKISVALKGRVAVKVTLENGPIEIGDPLTTSSIKGHAMKAADDSQSFGATIGKALEPFTGGPDGETEGVITTFVALH